mmetsp:Transcript_40812/g.115430  ORF Transcript_40812/g.115430 Transcript_40812/m.115430 type:complete len:307 (+) Transcript_40812:738-1658(+)
MLAALPSWNFFIFARAFIDLLSWSQFLFMFDCPTLSDSADLSCSVSFRGFVDRPSRCPPLDLGMSIPESDMAFMSLSMDVMVLPCRSPSFISAPLSTIMVSNLSWSSASSNSADVSGWAVFTLSSADTNCLIVFDLLLKLLAVFRLVTLDFSRRSAISSTSVLRASRSVGCSSVVRSFFFILRTTVVGTETMVCLGTCSPSVSISTWMPARSPAWRIAISTICVCTPALDRCTAAPAFLRSFTVRGVRGFDEPSTSRFSCILQVPSHRKIRFSGLTPCPERTSLAERVWSEQAWAMRLRSDRFMHF